MAGTQPRPVSSCSRSPHAAGEPVQAGLRQSSREASDCYNGFRPNFARRAAAVLGLPAPRERALVRPRDRHRPRVAGIWFPKWWGRLPNRSSRGRLAGPKQRRSARVCGAPGPGGGVWSGDPLDDWVEDNPNLGDPADYVEDRMAALGAQSPASSPCARRSPVLSQDVPAPKWAANFLRNSVRAKLLPAPAATSQRSSMDSPYCLQAEWVHSLQPGQWPRSFRSGVGNRPQITGMGEKRSHLDFTFAGASARARRPVSKQARRRLFDFRLRCSGGRLLPPGRWPCAPGRAGPVPAGSAFPCPPSLTAFEGLAGRLLQAHAECPGTASSLALGLPAWRLAALERNSSDINLEGGPL